MSDSINLHGFWRSLGTYRVRIALALKGLNYSENSVNVLKGEQFQDAISRLNPQCALPVMIHNDSTFTQSLAIIEYIEECFPTPPLLPANAFEKALVRSFALITVADAHPLTVPRVRKQLAHQFNASNDDIEQWARHWSRLALEAMETRLSENDKSKIFCFSNEPSIADIGLASQVAGARFFNLPIDSYPTICEKMNRINQCDEFVATAPEAIKARTGH